MKEKDVVQNKEVYRVFRGYVLTILFFTFLIVGYIVQSISISSIRYEIESLSEKRERLIKCNSNLRYKLQSLSNPAIIEKKAVNNYGFKLISTEDIITITKERRLEKDEDEKRDIFAYLWDFANTRVEASLRKD